MDNAERTEDIVASRSDHMDGAELQEHMNRGFILTLTAERTLQVELMRKIERLGAQGCWRAVLNLMDSKHRIKPNAFVWSAAIRAMGTQSEEAVKLISKMQSAGLQPTSFHVSAAITACSKKWALAKSRAAV
jgi:hypothetical protein